MSITGLRRGNIEQQAKSTTISAAPAPSQMRAMAGGMVSCRCLR
jgi:hypothetical protein